MEQALPIEPRGRIPCDTPGPEGRDMLPAIGRMRRDTMAWLKEQSDTYGPVVRFPIPRLDVLLVNDPEGVQRVLQGNHRGYSKRTIQYDTLALLTGRGLLTNDGDSWMRQRRLAQPAFNAHQLAAVGGHVAAAVAGLRRSWDALPPGAEVDVDAAMTRATLEVVGRSLFTTDFAGDADRIVPAVLAALDIVVQRASSLVRLPLSVPTPSNRRMRQAVATLDGAVEPLVQARRARAAAGGGDEAAYGDDLLGAYLTAGSPDTGLAPLTDREIRDEVVTLIVAGHETVASSLTWTWHLLGQHPEAADRIRDEVDTVVADGRAPTYDDLRLLPYTRQVVEESLPALPARLADHPAGAGRRRDRGAPHPRRGARHPVAVGDPARRALVGRPRTVRPRPLVAGTPRRRPALRVLPVGPGPRLCIGRDFALVESVLLLASLAARYELASVPGHDVHAEPLVTIRPRGGLPMLVTRR